jgi:hypothetical protein
MLAAICSLILPLAICGVQKDQPFQLPDSAVTGTYYEGDGLGVNHFLTLTAGHTFLFKGHTDIGVEEVNQGRWKYDGDILVLLPERANSQHDWTGTATRLIPIGWGKAVYLVSEGEAPGFQWLDSVGIRRSTSIWRNMISLGHSREISPPLRT